jgi:hypothetical protein
MPYNVGSRDALLAGRVCGGEDLKDALATDDRNTWDHPSLEFIPYKQWDAAKNRLYYYENTGLLISSGVTASEKQGLRLPAALAPAFESAGLMRMGYLELMRTLDTKSLKPYCERALALNPADSLAAASLRNLPGGVDVLIVPGQL